MAYSSEQFLVAFCNSLKKKKKKYVLIKLKDNTSVSFASLAARDIGLVFVIASTIGSIHLI